jgi:hypothetical protein
MHSPLARIDLIGFLKKLLIRNKEIYKLIDFIKVYKFQKINYDRVFFVQGKITRLFCSVSGIPIATKVLKPGLISLINFIHNISRFSVQL